MVERIENYARHGTPIQAKFAATTLAFNAEDKSSIVTLIDVRVITTVRNLSQTLM